MSQVKQATGPALIGEVVEASGGPIALVRAVIATLDEVDHDGDTYEPGAFSGASNVMISPWNHSTVVTGVGAPPVGNGSIREIGRHAVFTGELWLDTQAGRDTYTVLRRRGSAQQWSYAYDVLSSRRPGRGDPSGAGRVLQRLNAYEASPVWRGAGTGTATLELAGPPAREVPAEAQRELREIAARFRANQDVAREQLRFIALQARRRELASR